MYERVKRLRNNDTTLIAAAALIIAGLVAVGIPPYLLFGS